MMKIITLAFLVVALAQSIHGKDLDGRIVGGMDAKEGQFKSITNIMYYIYGAWQHLCGGSIIHDRWVLTAAHCLSGKRPAAIKVYLGALGRNDGTVQYQAEELFIHEDYSTDPNITHDVGLIKLTENIQFTDNIVPIRMNFKYVPGGETAFAAGWGMIDEEHSLEGQTLQYIQQTTLDQDTCSRILNSKNLQDHNICAFYQNGHGMCNGDSGGPLILGNQLIGIASWVRKPCGSGKPDVYVRINAFGHWITLTIARYS